MKIGIIREGKTPPDSRVLFTPAQCKALQQQYDVEFLVQPSAGRCIPDSAYEAAGITLTEDLSSCPVLAGIKEVPKDQLIANKTYFFFSHTIKKQPYNRSLLQEIVKKNIKLLDYEALTNENRQRVIAFGRFAGIVGAHNGMMTYGKRTGKFELNQMHQYDDYAAAIAYYETLDLPEMKIVLTGSGRVANGAAEVLDYMGIKKISPEDFLTQKYNEAVYTQLECKDYVSRRGQDKHEEFEAQHFYDNPTEYESIFEPYTKLADLMINGIYWDNNAPAFFTKEEMQSEQFNIKVIADVTCDIAPVASIPATLFATTIANPVFGYDPQTGEATTPYQAHVIDMMTIDNLPNELPKDASKSFGEQFTTSVIEELLGLKNTGVIERATVTEGGKLGKHFAYLQDYLDGKE